MRQATPTRSKETEAQKLRAQRRASGQPIRYKLPSHLDREAEANQRPAPATQTPVDDSDDFAPLVRGALRAASLIIVSQLGTSVLLGNSLGAFIRIGFLLKVFPYLEIQTTEANFGRIWMWAVIAGVAAGCGGGLYALWRHRQERNLLDGWGCGIAMAGLLVLIQAGQQIFFGPLLINSWVLAQAGAAVLASAMVFLGLRPGGKSSVSAGSSTGSIDPQRRGAFRQTNRATPPTK